jgi:hypothetical protein
VDVEQERGLIVGAGNFDGGTVGDSFSNASGGFGFLPSSGGESRTAGRDKDAKAVHDHTREVAGAQEQVDIVSLDAESLNGHDGRRVGGAAKPPESEALTDAAGMREKSRVEFPESDGRRKIFLGEIV